MPVVLRMRSPGWKIHSTPIRLAEIKYSDTSSAGKDVEIQEITHALLVGMYEWYNHSRKQFDGFLYNSTCNHHQTQQLHSWAFNQEKWKCMFLHNLGTNIQRSFIHNNPKLEITQTSTNRWMGKQAMTSLGRGERSNKMDSTHTGGEVDAYQKYYTECNKPNLKAYSVQDSSLSMEAFQWLPVVGGRGEGTDKGEDFAGKMFYLDCSVILATPYGTVP